MGNLKSTTKSTTKTTNLNKLYTPSRNIIFKNCIVWNCTCCQTLTFNETKIKRQRLIQWQWTNQHTISILYVIQNAFHPHSDPFPIDVICIIKSLCMNDPNTVKTTHELCTEFRLKSLTSFNKRPMCDKWYTKHGHKKLWSNDASLHVTLIGNAVHMLNAFSQDLQLPELQPRHSTVNEKRRTMMLDNKYPIRLDLTNISLKRFQNRYHKAGSALSSVYIIYFETMNDLLVVEKLCDIICLNHGQLNNHILYGNDIYNNINHKKVCIFSKSLNIPYVTNHNFNAFNLINFAIKYFWVSDTFYNYSQHVRHY